MKERESEGKQTRKGERKQREGGGRGNRERGERELVKERRERLKGSREGEIRTVLCSVTGLFPAGCETLPALTRPKST